MAQDPIPRIRKTLFAKRLKDVDESEVGDDTPLIDYGVGVDSVATLELIVALEEEFRITIDEEQITLDDLESINSLSELIQRNMSG